jgi:hypothetical protein
MFVAALEIGGAITYLLSSSVAPENEPKVFVLPS